MGLWVFTTLPKGSQPIAFQFITSFQMGLKGCYTKKWCCVKIKVPDTNHTVHTSTTIMRICSKTNSEFTVCIIAAVAVHWTALSYTVLLISYHFIVFSVCRVIFEKTCHSFCLFAFLWLDNGLYLPSLNVKKSSCQNKIWLLYLFTVTLQEQFSRKSYFHNFPLTQNISV